MSRTIYGTLWCACNHPVCLSGTCDALLCVSHTLQSALESGQEARIVHIDFSAAFDRVNHQGILHRLSSVGIGGSVLSVLTQFLSNRSQFVFVDGCRSKLVNVVSGVPQGSVLGHFGVLSCQFGNTVLQCGVRLPIHTLNYWTV